MNPISNRSPSGMVATSLESCILSCPMYSVLFTLAFFLFPCFACFDFFLTYIPICHVYSRNACRWKRSSCWSLWRGLPCRVKAASINSLDCKTEHHQTQPHCSTRIWKYHVIGYRYQIIKSSLSRVHPFDLSTISERQIVNREKGVRTLWVSSFLICMTSMWVQKCHFLICMYTEAGRLPSLLESGIADIFQCTPGIFSQYKLRWK